MTEEQIEQRAEKYADGFIADAIFKRYLRDAYIAGAHSRDEEISRMQESLDECRRVLFQLRNPWISIEDGLPEEPLTICAVWLKGDDLVPHISLYDSGRFLLLPVDVTVTHWMPIPQLSPADKLINGLNKMAKELKEGGAATES